MPNAVWGRYRRGSEVDVNGDPVVVTLQAGDDDRERYRLRGFVFVGYTTAPGIVSAGEALTPTIVNFAVPEVRELPPPGVSLAALEVANRPEPIVVEDKPDGEPAERLAAQHDAERNIEHLDLGKAIPVAPGEARDRRDLASPQPLTPVDLEVMRGAERDTPPAADADNDHMAHLEARSDANASKTGDALPAPMTREAPPVEQNATPAPAPEPEPVAPRTSTSTSTGDAKPVRARK